ncbi:uncharacterized protein EI90DRAFT_2530720 [Cantharellus anzutake]|uniref:uncharacterized protein n=1 Tax=Cantharellus anzutake TaxID=1750568 RepID=UPI001902EE2D|nr:uncharacterized protein EI90DRAFT_2530720 [Cantharellus anzutake]KAF8338010.1 hypothetical protein EI90DRAFT_2530720 [Cantharellus anzutake]
MPQLTMLLPLVGETDDSIPRPQTHDVLTSGGTFLLKTNSSQENVGTEDKDAPADAFFEMESGRSTLDTIEPIEDDKNTEFFTGDQPLLLKRTPTIFSTFSYGSVLSARSTREIFSLKDLCEKVIEKHLWLQMARIVSTSCYSQEKGHMATN